MLTIREVASEYDRAWTPAWAKGMPIYKIGDKDPPYTYADWLSWPEMEGKVELIDGLLAAMAMPSSFHQGIEGELYFRIRDYMRGKSGRVFASRLAVRLFPDRDDESTIAPDIAVVFDTAKLTMEGCMGAPDFVAEILSPSNRKEDLTVKFDKYREAGAREYWIIDPDIRTVQANILKDGEYIVHMYTEAEPVPSVVLAGLTVDFGEIFAYAAVGNS
jgi:Uma2 family endonuclease